MKTLFTLLAAIVLVSGCAGYGSLQDDDMSGLVGPGNAYVAGGHDPANPS